MLLKLIIFLGVNLFYCFCDNLVVEPQRTQSNQKNRVNECNIVDSLAVYKIEFEGRWSKEIFPKQYPGDFFID